MVFVCLVASKETQSKFASLVDKELIAKHVIPQEGLSVAELWGEPAALASGSQILCKA